MDQSERGLGTHAQNEMRMSSSCRCRECGIDLNPFTTGVHLNAHNFNRFFLSYHMVFHILTTAGNFSSQFLIVCACFCHLKVGFRYCGLAAEPDTTSQDGGQIRSLGTPLPLKAMYTPQRVYTWCNRSRSKLIRYLDFVEDLALYDLDKEEDQVVLLDILCGDQSDLDELQSSDDEVSEEPLLKKPTRIVVPSHYDGITEKKKIEWRHKKFTMPQIGDLPWMILQN
ncbi:hypothetical protein LSTR_LSTR005963 [Laodelphax striatellus]|uniref:Uncharacterized protein n=1 Tax=Laodelphax striatellus TaxID=195883 RepID=A0A482WEU2_LAOST|nr:hypothetical protein LSTR_LSTR005963 [Laodelphax striatellus]